MSAERLDYTGEVAKATTPLYERLKKQYSPERWQTLAPYIHEINRLKKEKNAVILAHNYMTPDVFYGVGDVMGDSLMLAQKAAQSTADIIIQCGVHFMAETSKILCPDKKVIIPDMKAGCSLAESITGEDVRRLKEQHPGIPVVSYVNTSADVKAESDVCCTSSNALKIVNALGEQGHDTVIMTPDKFLAQNVAAETDVKIIIWDGTCMVHERFTAEDVKKMRADHPGIFVLAHPECPPEVMAEADYAGSTAQMDDYIKEHQPKMAVLYTECSMSDNIAAANPGVEMIGTCQMCPHMKRITLPKILNALQDEGPEVEIDAEIAERAKAPIERMLELS
ncbi:MAG TPA: quinolinate synthase NadA [Alphaproteobacteria bacterium]|nr:quinolinate synthase NadA [Alphaproteobacteria bacterium]USO04846.1 MAG: quinolinate synthase NadA [Rhodospirillales bacterium]HOO80912.1 quinolinate synthase NadA [Alphaproteobacteria bacterium]